MFDHISGLNKESFKRDFFLTLSRLFKNLIIALFIVAQIGIIAIVVSLFLIFLSYIFEISKFLEFMTKYDKTIHILSLFIIIIFGCYVTIKSYGLKVRSKQIELLKYLFDESSRTKDDFESNCIILHRISSSLKEYFRGGLHRQIPRLRYRKYGRKEVSIFIPNIEKKYFESIYYSGDSSVFINGIQKLHPVFYNKPEWTTLLSEWAEFSKQKKEEEYDSFMKNKHKLISMCGYVFQNPNVYSVNDVDNCIPWDEVYLESLHEKYKITHKIRSFIATPLIHQGKNIGILFLTDCIKFAFFNSDKLLISIISNLYAKHIFTVLESKRKKDKNETSNSSKK